MGRSRAARWSAASPSSAGPAYSLDGIIAQVTEIATAVTDIAASAQEQASGLDEIK